MLITTDRWFARVLPLITQRQSREILEALRDGPWTLVDVQHGGFCAVFSHASADVEHPTPEYVTERMWPGKTYRRFRSLSVVLDTDASKIIHRQSSTGVPWAGASLCTLSNPKALAFIREPVDTEA